MLLFEHKWDFLCYSDLHIDLTCLGPNTTEPSLPKRNEYQTYETDPWSLNWRISDSVGPSEAQEFVFLVQSSQMMLMLLFWGRHFEVHYDRVLVNTMKVRFSNPALEYTCR